MSAEEDRRRRIEAAKETRGFLGSIDQMQNPDHRTDAIHDRVVGAIGSVCENYKETGGGHCFTVTQVECLKDIAFQIAYIVDPRDRRAPPEGWNKVKHDFKQASWLIRIPVIVGLLTFGITAIVQTGSAVHYLYSLWKPTAPVISPK